MRRRSDHVRSGAALLTVAMTLAAAAGCTGSSDDDPTPLESTLTDQKVCGLFTPDLVTSIVGHDDIAVRGSGIAGPDVRASNTIDCSIVDQERDKTPILVIVSEKSTAEQQAAATAMLDRELADKKDCSQPTSVTALGAGYACENVVGPQGPGYFYVNVLLDQRMIRMTYQAAPEAVSDGLATAIKLVEDVDANIDDYDRTHSEN